jgi:hypothetical protein
VAARLLVEQLPLVLLGKAMQEVLVQLLHLFLLEAAAAQVL